MDKVDFINNYGLLSLQLAYVGLENGICFKEEFDNNIINYLLENNSEDALIEIAINCKELNSEELNQTLKQYIEKNDIQYNEFELLEVWRLASFEQLLKSNYTDQEKVDKLQVLHSDFNWPEDMYGCSIYNDIKMPPLEAMKLLINKLKTNLNI